jgi:drug/metabolite transporter (DMT)-like permease
MSTSSRVAHAVHVKLIAASVFWAMTPIFGRMLADYHAPYALAFGRFAVASCALHLMLRALPTSSALPPRADWPSFLLLGLTGICLHAVLTLVAMEHTQANRANVIFASISLMIAVMDIVLFRRLPPPLALLGLAIGIAGTACVVTDGRPAVLLGGGIGLGEWLVLASAASWSVYSVLGRPLLDRYSPLVITHHATLCGTLLLAPLVVLDADVLGRLVLDVDAWLMVLFVGVLNSALAFLWYYEGVARLGAMRSSAYINLVPVSGVALSALLLGERASLPMLAGGALVIAGLVLLNRAPARG